MQTNLFSGINLIPNGVDRVLEKSATELKNDGIERAKNKADKENKSWSSKAYAFFIEYAKNSKEPFTCSDVVERSKGIIATPNDNRAWGAIAVMAIKSGIIKKIGYSGGSNPRHHCNPRNLYEYISK